MNLISGVEVTLSIPGAPARDAHGNMVGGDPREVAVGNVVPQPGRCADLDATRPEGARVAMTFHFPKTYAGSLKGCTVAYGGREYRVIGDPQPFPPHLCPGDHDRAVETEAVDG